MISVVSTATSCVLGYDFSQHHVNRAPKYNHEARIDVVGDLGHNVETSGWKAMYSSSIEDGNISNTKEHESEISAPYINSRNTNGAMYSSNVHNSYDDNENVDSRHLISENTGNKNKRHRDASNRSNADEYQNLYNGVNVPNNSEDVMVVIPSSQFQTEVPSTNNPYQSNDDITTQTSSEGQISLEDIEQSNSYGDKIHPDDSFRVPRRIHPYSTATSMYLAQENLFVAPRAFQVDQLPSTPQLNAIMNRAMSKVKDLLHELEDDKGKQSKKQMNLLVNAYLSFRNGSLENEFEMLEIEIPQSFSCS